MLAMRSGDFEMSVTSTTVYHEDTKIAKDTKFFFVQTVLRELRRASGLREKPRR